MKFETVWNEEVFIDTSKVYAITSVDDEELPASYLHINNETIKVKGTSKDILKTMNIVIQPSRYKRDYNI